MLQKLNSADIGWVKDIKKVSKHKIPLYDGWDIYLNHVSMQQQQQRNKALFVIHCICKLAASSKQTFLCCALVCYRKKDLQIYKIYYKSKSNSASRAYSRPLFSVSIAPNLYPEFWKWYFNLKWRKMVSVWRVSPKKMTLIQWNVLSKNKPMH